MICFKAVPFELHISILTESLHKLVKQQTFRNFIDVESVTIEPDDTNITDIFAHLSVINSDGVYCEDESKLWDTVLYPARCPKLNWQLGSNNVDGGTDLPGWSEEEW